MVRLFLVFFAFLSSLFSASALQAQTLNFYSDVSPKAGTMDDTFILSVVIENPGSQITAPYLVGGDDFDVRFLGPRQSTTIINGAVTTETAYNYELTPKREGLLESPSAEVEYNGRKLSVPPIKVKVDRSLSGATKSTDHIFLRQSIDKDSVFLGQQARYTLSLYTDVTILDYSFADTPSEGLWTQAIGDVQKSITNINGRRYNLFRWHKALYPLRTGEITVPERELRAKFRVPMQNRRLPFGFDDPFEDPFDTFFGRSKIEQKTFRAAALQLNVKPLPPAASKLESWGNANVLVGKTEIRVDYDSSGINTGDNKTITIDIMSFGNLNSINRIPLSDGPGFRIYQDTPVEKNTDRAGELYMVKSFKISVIPLRPGTLKLPEIKLSYFDPQSERYETASSGIIEFNVAGSDLTEKKPSAGTVSQTKKQSAPAVNEEEAKDSSPALPEEPTRPGVNIPLVLFVLAICVVILLGVFLFYHLLLKKRRERDLLAPVKATEDLNTLSSETRRYLIKKLNLPDSLTLKEEFSAELRRRGLDKGVIYEIEKHLDSFDLLLYSKERPAAVDIAKLREDVIKTLLSL